MHGRRRDEYKARLQNTKIAAGLAQKAQQWNTLSQELLKRRRQSGEVSKERDAETLALIEKLLLVNPDPLALWNHRRELILAKTGDFEVSKELVLTASCLERNPKAYGAWFHRKWSIRKALSAAESSTSSSTSLLERELALCAQFLKLDERNFHCWNYRRFVVSALLQICATPSTSSDDEREGKVFVDGSWLWEKEQDVLVIMGAQVASPDQATSLQGLVLSLNFQLLALLQSEWDFTTQKIHENFSNCSAFHYRSKLLPLKLLASEDASPLTMARTELEMVHNAIFTEPDDQTAWWYHRFLLADWLAPFSRTEDYKELILEEEELLTELIDTEDGQSKWAWLGLHMVLTQFQDNPDKTRILECLDKLAELDPDRAARYESLKE